MSAPLLLLPLGQQQERWPAERSCLFSQPARGLLNQGDFLSEDRHPTPTMFGPQYNRIASSFAPDRLLVTWLRFKSQSLWQLYNHLGALFSN
jgi:hypothetical protein